MGLNPLENYLLKLTIAIVSSYQVVVVMNLQLDHSKKEVLNSPIDNK